jgi:ornithine carbamoyltransferase
MKTLKTDHLTSLKDLSAREIADLMSLTRKIKSFQKSNIRFTPLRDRILAMIFSKSSTRTRLSFEAGIRQLGGTGIYLNASDLQIGRGETIADTARVLSRFVDAIMIRTYSHEDVTGLAKFASIPVINGLTDFLHPCQTLADLFTISETMTVDWKKPGFRVCYMGDANNVANSWLEAAVILGFGMDFVVPKEYDFGKEIFIHLGLDRKSLPSNIRITNDPSSDIVRDADFLYTDVWVSMGQEKERDARLSVLRPFQINETLIGRCKPSVKVMHCLPAHRGEEISAGVMDGPASVVFDQAENRLHAQKALMTMLMGKGKLKAKS